tara:strand:+ start:188 stop:514 length:327 start_codon:yes stop_codon:yes gene_type:complete
MRNQYCDNEIVVVIVFANRFGAHPSGRGYLCVEVTNTFTLKLLMMHQVKQLLQQLRSSRNSSQKWLLAGIGVLLLPLAKLLLNVQKQLGYHESVLIVVLVGIMVVLQH